MKKVLLTMMIAIASIATQAQEIVQDQNPNYKQSMDKYAASKESLQTTMNTTVQSTYKAYDWSTAKAERQKDKRDFRRQRQLYSIYNGYGDDYYDDDYGYRNNRYNNGYNNYRYNNGYNNNYNRRYNNYNRNNCFFWFW
jgi:opacity protein-like surface antigen